MLEQICKSIFCGTCSHPGPVFNLIKGISTVLTACLLFIANLLRYQIQKLNEREDTSSLENMDAAIPRKQLFLSLPTATARTPYTLPALPPCSPVSLACARRPQAVYKRRATDSKCALCSSQVIGLYPEKNTCPVQCPISSSLKCLAHRRWSLYIQELKLQPVTGLWIPII